MTNEQFARAKELRDRIEYLERQQRVLSKMQNIDVKLNVSSSEGSLNIPNGEVRLIIIGVLAGDLNRRIAEAKKEYEVL